MIITNNSRTLLQSQINSSKHGSLISVNDVVSDKQKKIHDVLYKEALENMKLDYSLFFEKNTNNTIIYTEQINENGYDKPSHVIVTVYDKSEPHKSDSSESKHIKIPVARYDIDLTKWWNTSYMNIDNSIITNNKNNVKAKYEENYDWSNCECVYIDYVNDKVIVRNRIDGWVKNISINKFNAINNKEIIIPMSEQMSLLNTSNSFAYQYQNL